MLDPEGAVFIVDDDPSVCRSLQRLLESADHPSEAFRSADEFLASWDSSRPGCLLLDVRMPGMSGVELHKLLLAQGREIPILMMSGHSDILIATEALRRGALDFLTKPVDPKRLLESIRFALVRDAEARYTRLARQAIEDRLGRLTPRERDVVDLIVTGSSTKEIAAWLEISPQAVAAHRMKAMARLDVSGTAGLVRLLLVAESLGAARTARAGGPH